MTQARLKVLVTGARGFIGSAVVRELNEQGLDVIPAARPRGDAESAQYAALDITRPETLRPHMQGVDAVVHAAGLAHQFGAAMRTAPFTAVNVEGAANVAEAAAKSGVREFILLSSVAVYGRHDVDVVDEDHPCRPATRYGVSKLEGERSVRRIADEAGMSLKLLRLATVYGEGDPGNISRLVRSIDRGRFVWVGDGSNRKSLIYRDDVARACLAVLLAQTPQGGTFNVSARAATVREIVEGICAGLGKRVPRWRIPTRAVLDVAAAASRFTPRSSLTLDLLESLDKWLANDVYDATRFARAFAFEPASSLREGLQRQVEWYMQRDRFGGGATRPSTLHP